MFNKPWLEEKTQFIIASAIWYQDVDTDDYLNLANPYNVDKGIVVVGRRHHNCLHTFNAITKLRSVENEIGHIIEGFLTSNNLFVDRREAAKIAFEAGQTATKIKALFSEHIFDNYVNGKLISEDSYIHFLINQIWDLTIEDLESLKAEKSIFAKNDEEALRLAKHYIDIYGESILNYIMYGSYIFEIIDGEVKLVEFTFCGKAYELDPLGCTICTCDPDQQDRCAGDI
jgi:hypothetical protein